MVAVSPAGLSPSIRLWLPTRVPPSTLTISIPAPLLTMVLFRVSVPPREELAAQARVADGAAAGDGGGVVYQGAVGERRGEEIDESAAGDLARHGGKLVARAVVRQGAVYHHQDAQVGDATAPDACRIAGDG